jgi:predicted dienelactone hydrolase
MPAQLNVPRRIRLTVRLQAAAALVLALLVAATPLATTAQPAPYETAGSTQVQVRDLLWADPARQRSLPLRLRLPDGTGRVPVVLFSHGLGGSVDAGQFWAEHWASHGFAVLHLQHPGSDTAVWKEAKRPAKAMREAASAEQLIARAADVKFVLDELERRRRSTDPEDAWVRRLDLTRIGMSGHSFGAGTTQAIAGQSYGRRGAALMDPRPRAFIAFSPSGSNAGAADFAKVTRPLLALTGSADGEVGMGLGVPPEQRRAVFEALPAGDKTLVWLTGADHMIFGGSPRIAGLSWNTNPDPAQDALHQRIVRATTLAFWRATLLDDAQARTWLQRQAAAYVGAAGEVVVK